LSRIDVTKPSCVVRKRTQRRTIPGQSLMNHGGQPRNQDAIRASKRFLGSMIGGRVHCVRPRCRGGPPAPPIVARPPRWRHVIVAIVALLDEEERGNAAK